MRQVDEDHPQTHRNAYSLSRQAGELAADTLSRLGCTIPVSLRPAWVVAPGEVRARGLLDLILTCGDLMVQLRRWRDL